MNKIILSKLANHIQAHKACNPENEWKQKHLDAIEEMSKLLPHGSGIDGKCEFQLELCKKDKIVLLVEFHHMDENGYYDSWTDHNIIITPSFIHGFDMKITGKNRNMVKEYLSDIFRDVFWVSSFKC